MPSTQQPNNPTTSKIIFIVGPTSSGKSTLAFELANQINANILVADSRQIYKDIPITSGADIPSDFDLKHDPTLTHSFFTNDRTELHGVSFLEASDDWSLGLFYQLAQTIIRRTLSQNKVLIIVGGTGLYTHSLLLSADQIFPPPSLQLRTELQSLSLTELQQKITSINEDAQKMFNESDWQNPRRLIRAVEILSISPNQKIDINEVKNSITVINDQSQTLTIEPTWYGLEIDKDTLEQKIKVRVQQRISDGAIQEVEKLLSKVENKKANIFTTTGVKEIKGYLEEQYDQSTLIELWTKREFQYAKRQLTWFKKRTYIQWINKEELQTHT